MKNYSEIIFKTGPVQTIDYVNDRYDVIHEKLYKNALNLLITDIAKTDYHNRMFVTDESILTAQPEMNQDNILADDLNSTPLLEYIKNYVKSFKKTHKFIEIKNDEYYKPSFVLCINNEFPFERKK